MTAAARGHRFAPTLRDPPLQELLMRERDDPWRIAVACILLTRTGRWQVDRVWPQLFGQYPVPGLLAYGTRDGELERLLHPLGLPGRARTLQRMSHAWLQHPAGWRDGTVTGYPGLGRYAQDSHDIFALGRLDLLPEDRVLDAWTRLLRSTPVDLRPTRYRPARPSFAHPPIPERSSPRPTTVSDAPRPGSAQSARGRTVI